jgi:hypothetical protein
MSNPTFTTAVPDTLPPDPSKHVNYTQGMVLGVDDFQQEFAYLSHRDQWLARDAIGYGTVSGLHVSLDAAQPNSISVTPGVAINPRGQLIRVAPRQCARIDAWLGLPTTIDRLNKLGIGGSGEFSAYVVLCYRDCPADELPVPGEPCRCDSTTKAPSRIIDDFRLELTLDAPLQLEEDVVRRLVEWLRLIPVVEDFDPAPGSLEAFLEAIKETFSYVGSPPEAPSIFFPESPPSELYIPRSHFCEWMRAAMLLWVTELRPLWQALCAPKKSCACGGPCGCHGTGAKPESMECECLLLAEVAITRAGGAITGVVLDDGRRPFLVHLRMLQELLLCGPCCGEGAGAELGSPPSSPAAINILPATTVVAENVFGPNPKGAQPGGSLKYAREDHTHGLPVDPIPGHLLKTADHFPHQIKGDVTGTLGATVVAQLQGVPVSPALPLKDQVLQFDSPTKTWVPKNPAAGGAVGNFVERPNVGRYLIVAAGWFRIPAPRALNLAPLAEPYNKLSGKRVAGTSQQFLLTFGGNAGSAMDRYISPTDTFTYIVKGTTFGRRPGFFHVIGFSRDGIIVHVAEIGNDVGVEAFMVEISLFGPF